MKGRLMIVSNLLLSVIKISGMGALLVLGPLISPFVLGCYLIVKAVNPETPDIKKDVIAYIERTDFKKADVVADLKSYIKTNVLNEPSVADSTNHQSEKASHSTPD